MRRKDCHVYLRTDGISFTRISAIAVATSLADVLEKALRYVGYDVKRVMNITDVGHLSSDADTGEDKMLKGAMREHKTVMEICEVLHGRVFDDCKS